MAERELVHRSAFVQMGETAARVMARGNGPEAAEAGVWVAEQETLRTDAAAAKRDAREEETLSIAREANRIASEALSIAKSANLIAAEHLSAARRNARWAMYAAIVATFAAAISAKDQLLALIFGSS